MTPWPFFQNHKDTIETLLDRAREVNPHITLLTHKTTLPANIIIEPNESNAEKIIRNEQKEEQAMAAWAKNITERYKKENIELNDFLNGEHLIADKDIAKKKIANNNKEILRLESYLRS